jgi:rhodanese-related sulfurtransferase
MIAIKKELDLARLMSSTELYQYISEKSDGIVVVDVLSPEEYSREHIPGAINIPLEKLSTAASQLNKNNRIIVYGGAHEHSASNKAAEVLEGLGFRRVADFDGGLNAWKQAGYKVDPTGD